MGEGEVKKRIGDEGKLFCRVHRLLCSRRGPLPSSSVCADGTWTAQRKRKEDKEEACSSLKELQAALGCEAPVTESELPVTCNKLYIHWLQELI